MPPIMQFVEERFIITFLRKQAYFFSFWEMINEVKKITQIYAEVDLKSY